MNQEVFSEVELRDLSTISGLVGVIKTKEKSYRGHKENTCVCMCKDHQYLLVIIFPHNKI